MRLSCLSAALAIHNHFQSGTTSNQLFRMAFATLYLIFHVGFDAVPIVCNFALCHVLECA